MTPNLPASTIFTSSGLGAYLGLPKPSCITFKIDKQTSKPMSPKMRTDVAAKPTAGRMTAADMFEKRKKDKNKAMIRKMKPLRIR